MSYIDKAVLESRSNRSYAATRGYCQTGLPSPNRTSFAKQETSFLPDRTCKLRRKATAKLMKARVGRVVGFSVSKTDETRLT